MLQFAALGSGSSGNATLIRSQDTCVLLDCGFTIKETTARLQQLGLQLQDLAAIVVTHEHADHLGGVAPLARRFRMPVYMTHGTYRRARDKKFPQLKLFHAFESLRIGDLALQPFPTPHDAAESCQFVFSSDRGARLATLTDLGCTTSAMLELLQGLDALLLECNYDTQMLRDGPYPPSLQNRIRGAYGHLGNEQAADFLQLIDYPGLQQIVLAHLSEKNNTPAAAYDAVLRRVESAADRMQILQQDAVSQWYQIG